MKAVIIFAMLALLSLNGLCAWGQGSGIPYETPDERRERLREEQDAKWERQQKEWKRQRERQREEWERELAEEKAKNKRELEQLKSEVRLLMEQVRRIRTSPCVVCTERRFWRPWRYKCAGPFTLIDKPMPKDVCPGGYRKFDNISKAEIWMKLKCDK